MKFAEAQVTASGLVKFGTDEVAVRVFPKVDFVFEVDSGEQIQNQDGELHVTTYRLIWLSKQAGAAGGERDSPLRPPLSASLPLGSLREVQAVKKSLFSNATPRARMTLLPHPGGSSQAGTLTFVFRGSGQQHLVQFLEDVSHVKSHSIDAQPISGVGSGVGVADATVDGTTPPQAPQAPQAPQTPQPSQTPQPPYPLHPPTHHHATATTPSLGRGLPQDWACSTCTLINASDAKECLACGSPCPANSIIDLSGSPDPPPSAQYPSTQHPLPLYPPPHHPPPAATLPHRSSQWTCAQCTLINQAVAQECEACGGPPPPVLHHDHRPPLSGTRPQTANHLDYLNPVSNHAPPAHSSPSHAPSAYPYPSFNSQGQVGFPTDPSPSPFPYPSLQGQPMHLQQRQQQQQQQQVHMSVDNPIPKPDVSSLTANSAGIAGLLRQQQEKEGARDRTLEAAFGDLTALMEKAKEMVEMAELLKVKVRKEREAGGAEDAETGRLDQELEDLLLDAGISNPVTRETAGALFHQQLARQLCDFLREVLEMRGGVMALTDVYCLFNRARGAELVSPEDVLQACRLWSKLGLELSLCDFESGVLMVKSPAHSDAQVCLRIKELLGDSMNRSITVGEVSKALQVPLTIAQEYLQVAENAQELCRDDAQEGLRYYNNFFKDACVVTSS